jgi:hypothetical protein
MDANNSLLFNLKNVRRVEKKCTGHKYVSCFSETSLFEKIFCFETPKMLYLPHLVLFQSARNIIMINRSEHHIKACFEWHLHRQYYRYEEGEKKRDRNDDNRIK